ncbi:axoneme-associated protein mst101(2)-like [Euwallacea fornicatus]|uniref:axoneme-associated protein mst101(2)-like n=1 Tax=Euwallacea fornicatus TaxID=995702 RepID=UPI00338F1054
MTTRQQENEVTAQRRETLVPVGEAGEREGPHRPLSSDLSASQTGDQVGMQTRATGTKERKKEIQEKTPVERQRMRKLSTVVSPPEFFTPGKTPERERQKNITFLNLTWDEEEHRSIKRKKAEKCEGEVIGRSPDRKLKGKLKKLLSRMEKEIKNLRKVVKENQNTKKEIKEITENLNSISNGIMTKEIQNILFVDLVEEERQETKGAKMTTSIGTQTERVEYGAATQVGERELEELGEIESLEDFKEVERKKWKKNLFQRTETKVGNPLETGATTVKIVWLEPNDPNMESSIQALYKKRYPDIVEFEEDFEVIEQTLKRRSGQQTNKPAQKIIKIKSEHTDEEVWKYLGKIRDETEKDEEIAMHHLGNLSMEKLAKMIEVRFRGCGNKISIYTTTEKIKETENEPKRRHEKSYALIVSNKENEYEGTLKKIKGNLMNLPEKKVIKEIRKTREGNLIITMEKDSKALETIRKEVQKETGLKVRESGEYVKRCAVHIKGLEVDVTKEEIQEAIIKTLGMEGEHAEEIKIGEIRPNAYGTKAVTVNMKETDANKLVIYRDIRIGLVKCVAEKHMTVKRCYGCGAYDHTKSQCKMEEKGMVCFRCGENGHSYRECKGDERCPSCKKKGHMAGTGKCPIFREALANYKKLERDRLRQINKEEEKKEKEKVEMSTEETTVVGKKGEINQKESPINENDQ